MPLKPQWKRSARGWLLSLTLLGLLGLEGRSRAAQDETFPPVTPLTPGVKQSRRLERTLQLLAKSTAENPNTVRIVFFGQTLAQPTWFTNLIQSLKDTYPNAHILGENRALDNHLAEHVVRYAEAELYPRRPDLVIYSAVGHADFIKKQINEIRRRTSADILLLTAPLRRNESLDEPADEKTIVGDPKKFQLTPENYFPWLNYVWLPKLAEEFDTAIVDIRTGWKAHLKQHQLTPDRLLPDNTRPNAHGQYLMTSLIRPWFDLGLWNAPYDLWDNDRVSTYRIPRDAKWKGNQLQLSFDGVGVELLVDKTVDSRVQVQIDGRAASDVEELRIHGRCSNIPKTPWPGLLRVGKAAPLLGETWTLSVREVTTNDAGKFTCKFSLVGSKTGPDGEGTSEYDFLSKSHRVEIQGADWDLAYLSQKLKVNVPESFDLTWSEMELGTNEIGPGVAMEQSGATVVPLAFGLKPRRHTLTLTAEGTAAPAWLQGVRVYKPVLRTKER